LVSNARVGRLATNGPTGAPHIVPIVFAIEAGEIVSAIDFKPKTTSNLQRLENLRADPRATLLVDQYDEDWSRLWWVRLDCSAQVIDSGPDFASAVAALVEKYGQYSETPPPGPVIRLRVQSTTGWTAT
jgi:PPOX class probable F420-dependent enzyme